MNKLILFLISTIVVYILLQDMNPDKFSALGALTQLYAKGPQDMYLTPDSYGYNFYPYHYSPYRYMMWNMPTRLNNYYYPRNGYYPFY